MAATEAATASGARRIAAGRCRGTRTVGRLMTSIGSVGRVARSASSGVGLRIGVHFSTPGPISPCDTTGPKACDAQRKDNTAKHG